MKNILVILCLFLQINANCQVITDVAGNGTMGYTGDNGLANSAELKIPVAVCFDVLGNMYIADASNNRIRKVTISDTITTIAGNGSAGYNGDSILATNASLNNPSGIAVNSNGEIFISDFFNNRIRKISSDGIISTYAGTGVSGSSADNIPATTAMISNPSAIVIDKFDNVYFNDGNGKIRKVNLYGIISTVAGTTSYGYNGDSIPATSAKLYDPHVALDNNGNLYIADFYNYRVRKVDVTSGIITTIAGNGTYGYSGDNGLATDAQLFPWDVVVDKAGTIYISDDCSNTIRQVSDGIITTIAGNGILGYSGTNGIATNAEFNHPYGLAIDSCNNLYISDGQNNRVRKVSFNPACWPENINNITPVSISIYPSPATDFLNIDNIQTKTTYHLLNIIGTSIQQGTLQQGSNSVSVQALPAGIYLLQFTDNSGTVTVHKIIKQ